MSFSRACPTYADDLATADSSDEMLAHPPEAPTPSPFDDVAGEDLQSQSRTVATPVKGYA
jgi:hypothetical protein